MRELSRIVGTSLSTSDPATLKFGELLKIQYAIHIDYMKLSQLKYNAVLTKEHGTLLAIAGGTLATLIYVLMYPLISHLTVS